MATITVRLDDKLKKNFADTCEELGMDMTTAFTIFAKKVSREKKIPFEVSVDPFYSESNMKALYEAKKRMESGRGVAKTMEDLEAMENG